MPGGHRALFLLGLLDHDSFSSSAWRASPQALTFPDRPCLVAWICPSDAGVEGHIPLSIYCLFQETEPDQPPDKDLNSGYCHLFLWRWFKRLGPCCNSMRVPRWGRESWTCSRKQGPALDQAQGGIVLFTTTARPWWSQGDLCVSE